MVETWAISITPYVCEKRIFCSRVTGRSPKGDGEIAKEEGKEGREKNREERAPGSKFGSSRSGSRCAGDSKAGGARKTQQ